MAAARHLAQAPITEALIDFRAQATRPLEQLDLARLERALAPRYPSHETLKRIEVKFESRGGKPSADRVPTHVGWMFRSADQRQVAQFRTDGFTFNRLRPYTRWEELFPQAVELWKQYVELAKPAQVGRLAVRFINRLDRLDPLASFGLAVPPRMPPGLTLALRSFLNRQVVLDLQHGLSANVTQTAEEAIAGAKPTLLLDIDAFWEGPLDPVDPRIEGIFGLLRDMKNRIFFATITEETARLYE